MKRLEIVIRGKIDQRTTGGPMALRKAFKYFDTDGSGDIDPDEFYAAMRAFGLEFTEDQVLALFAHYDVDYDGALSYYEFVDKVLESGFGLDSDKKAGEPVMVQLATVVQDKKEVRMKTVLNARDVNEEHARKMFDSFDANNSGEIDLRELTELTKSLGIRMSTEMLNNAMFELDTNRNGAISFEEFFVWFKDAATSNSAGRGPPKTGSKTHSSPSRAQSREGSRISRPNTSHSGMSDLKSSILGNMGVNTPADSPKMGQWLTGGPNMQRPASGMSRPASRPGTRNSQRSVAGADYIPPPLCHRAPRIRGLSAMRRRKAAMENMPPRPSTAPTDLFMAPASAFGPRYVIKPGDIRMPRGVRTGYKQ